MKARDAWPGLPLDEWSETLATLHRWFQVVGKLRLMRSPLVNHWWNVTYHPTARGLTTRTIPHGDRAFEVTFDFVDHRLRVEASDGEGRELNLRPRSVADFHRELEAALAALDLETPMRTLPNEIEGAVPFEEDVEHASYDPDAAQRFWRILLSTHAVFDAFRAPFVGKQSPSHFFWGSCDLAVTRFSGRRAPTPEGSFPNFPRWANAEAYSHECSSAGFWPGPGLGHASYYAYCWPEPEGYSSREVAPDAAAYNPDMGQFQLPYDAVRESANPAGTLWSFLEATYEAAAECGGWDREALERPHGELEALRERVSLNVPT